LVLDPDPENREQEEGSNLDPQSPRDDTVIEPSEIENPIGTRVSALLLFFSSLCLCLVTLPRDSDRHIHFH
jgi:hypothetical protein